MANDIRIVPPACPAQTVDQWRRYHMAFDGSSDSVAYPPLPDSVGRSTFVSGPSRFLVDGQGRLVLNFFSSKMTGAHSGRLVIVRLDPDTASSEILFDSWDPGHVDQFNELIDMFTGP
jgi:hypothetical protein